MVNVMTSADIIDSLQDIFRNDPDAMRREFILDFKDETETLINQAWEEDQVKLAYYKFTYNCDKGNITFMGNEEINWNKIQSAGELIGKNILKYDANQREFMTDFVKAKVDPNEQPPKMTWEGYMVFKDGTWVERKLHCITFCSWAKGGDAPLQEVSDYFKIKINWN